MGPYEGNKAKNRGRGGRLRGGSPEGTPSNWGGGSVAKRLGSRAAVPGDAAWFWGCGWGRAESLKGRCPGWTRGDTRSCRLPAALPEPEPPGALGRQRCPKLRKQRVESLAWDQPGGRVGTGGAAGRGDVAWDPSHALGGLGRSVSPRPGPGPAGAPSGGRPAGFGRVKAAGRPSPSQSPGRGAPAPGRAGAGPDVPGRSEPAGPALIPHGAPAARSPRTSAARTCEMGRSRPTPPPLLLVALALLGAARADGDLSLHPPYFNLAEGARIAASATCGEEAPARGSPRPTEDLYCKLVGGPVAGGDPNQTIQVSAGGQGRRGRGAPGFGLGHSRLTWRGAPRARGSPGSDGSPLSRPTLRFHISENRRDPNSAIQAVPENCVFPSPPAPPGRRDVASGADCGVKGAGWCPDLGGPESRDAGEVGLGSRRRSLCGGRTAPPSPGLAGTCCWRPDGTGTGREGPDPGGSPC